MESSRPEVVSQGPSEAGTGPRSLSLTVPPRVVAPSSGDETTAAVLEQARRQWRQGSLLEAAESYRTLLAAGGIPGDAEIELGLVEQALGDTSAAVVTWRRLLDSVPGEPLASRARLLLATAELNAENWQALPRMIDASTAPDGLDDLVILRRARAAVGMGDPGSARRELARPEMRGSTNRLILEQAGQMADELGDQGLAGELYARGGRYFGWTAERSRIIKLAGDAFLEAGDPDRAVEQYGYLVENYGWTAVAARAGATLDSMDRLDPYLRGLIAINDGEFGIARSALAEAAVSGPSPEAAARRLAGLEESLAWTETVNSGTADAYRGFTERFPRGSRALDAWFEEGLTYYEADQLETARRLWDAGAQTASGDQKARLLMWAGKASSRMGDEDGARSRLEGASAVRPAGYYAVRARDLVSGNTEWPHNGDRIVQLSDADLKEAEEWVAGWAKGGNPPDAARRVERGFGLAALGMAAEATVEFNQLIAESQDGLSLLGLGKALADGGLWSSASRAAGRIVALSPSGSVVDAPRYLQQLVYPPAYWELVSVESQKRGLDPLLFLALMHQESRYDPYALSLSDARGLTQVIPPTGAGIASALGRKDFNAEQLYTPSVAVEFGVWYLANQLSRFGSDTFKGIASYNAGAGPISRWAASDPDLFVERIDYSETRSYVRQIYLHHAIYRSLSNR